MGGGRVCSVHPLMRGEAGTLRGTLACFFTPKIAPPRVGGTLWGRNREGPPTLTKEDDGQRDKSEGVGYDSGMGCWWGVGA